MATASAPATKTKRGKVPQPQTAAELARSEIKGQGPYLVASISVYPNRCVPSPLPGVVPDLILSPFQSKVIDQRWLDSIVLLSAYRKGEVQLEFTTTIPQAGEPEMDLDLIAGLDVDQVGFIREAARLPLSQQFLLSIKLADTLSENGLPGARSPRVTKNYLKTEHIMILKALRDLERRYQNRAELLAILDEQIKKIEAL